MILEIKPHLFALNNNPDGDLTNGWFAVPGATAPPLNGGPSIRWNPLDSMYCVPSPHSACTAVWRPAFCMCCMASPRASAVLGGAKVEGEGSERIGRRGAGTFGEWGKDGGSERG